jgi:hypothetical protein
MTNEKLQAYLDEFKQIIEQERVRQFMLFECAPRPQDKALHSYCADILKQLHNKFRIKVDKKPTLPNRSENEPTDEPYYSDSV